MLIPNPDLDFWSFDPKIQFWANLARKIQSYPFCLKIGTHGISRMLILNPDLDFWSFDTKIQFWANLGPKIQSCQFCLKIGAHSISRIQIPNLDLDFWNSDPKTHIWANFGQRSQSCSLFLKIGTHGILTMLNLIPTLVFWISKPKSSFGKIWTERLKAVEVGWKLVHRVSQRFSFLFWYHFSQFPTLNPFLDKFGPENSNLFILTENWYTWYIKDVDSYSNNSFLNCQRWTHFWENFGWKSQSCLLFCLKFGTHAHTHTVPRKCWFLFQY